MKLKNKQCELGHWMEPQIFDHYSHRQTPEFHLWWQCQTCESKKAIEYLARIEQLAQMKQSEKMRKKKVIQKSDTKVPR